MHSNKVPYRFCSYYCSYRILKIAKIKAMSSLLLTQMVANAKVRFIDRKMVTIAFQTITEEGGIDFWFKMAARLVQQKHS